MSVKSSQFWIGQFGSVDPFFELSVEFGYQFEILLDLILFPHIFEFLAALRRVPHTVQVVEGNQVEPVLGQEHHSCELLISLLALHVLCSSLVVN